MAARKTAAKPATAGKRAKGRHRAARGSKGSAKAGRGGFARLLRTALALGIRLALVGLVVALAAGIWIDFKVRAQFEGRKWAVPGRVYARPQELFVGQALTREEMLRELAFSSYTQDAKLVRPGSFTATDAGFRVRTRGFRFWDAHEPPRQLDVDIRNGRITRLAQAHQSVPIARLEPAVIGRFDARHNEDRVLVRLDDVTPLLPAALIAIEDRRFYRHLGISPRALARAVVANIRAGQTVQGGSTLTQQLVKNYFLTSERSLKRKLTEAAYAVVLELRYTKTEILEAYLNEVFLGQDGSRSINGFGLAARHYFGRPASELLLHEAALLAAIVRGASYYNPRRHPERATARRNQVIDLLAKDGVVTVEQAEAAKAQPLGLRPQPRNQTLPYASFMSLVREQVARDYREEDLRSEGLRIFTTLDPRLQQLAQSSVGEQLAALEAAPGAAGRGRESLEGAAIVTVPQTGEVLALVGSRSAVADGFNRALDARRPVGSLLKPFVLLTALGTERNPPLTLASLVEDAPITLRQRGSPPWSPRNYDREFHGPVTLYEALTRSYNAATVRIGETAGVGALVETLERFGIERKVRPLPSLYLGSLELSPLAVASLYQPLANEGLRVPLRAIREVTRADGSALKRYGLSVEQVADPTDVYLVEAAMRGVMTEGTARFAYASGGLAETMTTAGKTGTTNDSRDSWFAGFSADRLTVSWVGRDDNQGAGLTGASGALRVWRRIMREAARRPRRDAAPLTVRVASVDTGVGMLTDDGCPDAKRLPFATGTEPVFVPCGGQPAPAPTMAETWPSKPERSGLFERLFGREPASPGEPAPRRDWDDSPGDR